MASEEHAVRLPNVFIGSSTEGLDVARAIEQHLQDVANTTIWKYGVFRPGVSLLQSLLEAVDSFDFAVLALTPDDVVDSRDDSYSSPRDNVVFELGLFMGSLGPRRTFFLAEENALLKLPSDLAGIAKVDYRRRDNLAAAVSAACTVLRDEIEKQGCIAGRKGGVVEALSQPEAGPEHELRLAARAFYGAKLEARRAAAQKILQTGAEVPLRTVLLMMDSMLAGERVAAPIALRAHLEASPNLQTSDQIAAAVRRGLKDSRSRVRFRHAQLLRHAPDLANLLRSELTECLAAEKSGAVRVEVKEALQRAK